MGSPPAIPFDPLGEPSECIIRIVDSVLPEHLPIHVSKKSFNHAVLFRCVGSDALLRDVVLPGWKFSLAPIVVTQRLFKCNFSNTVFLVFN
jgi:hypothetical protein